MTLRALIFDVDGTLAETEEAHRDSFNRAFADTGIGWTWDRDLYRKLLKIGGGRERIVAYARDHAPDFLAARDSDAAIEKLHEIKTRHYGEWLKSGDVRLRPGIARLIGEALDARVKLAIATTSRGENVRGLLVRTLGPDGPKRFTIIAAAEAAKAKKPAPDVYLAALEGLGLPAADCLAIEDAPIGLKAARAAGIPTVIAEYFYTAERDFEDAVAVVGDLGEPDKPTKFVRGDPMGRTYVDLTLLRAWHAAA